MSVAAPPETTSIGVYRVGDFSKLPGRPEEPGRSADQRNIQAGLRLPLESIIKSVVRTYDRELYIEGPRPQDEAGKEYGVFVYPPFETAEEITEVGQKIQEKWEPILERWHRGKMKEFGDSLDPAVIEYLDTFIPAEQTP